MTITVDYLRWLDVVKVSEGGDTIFVRRDQAVGFIADFMAALRDAALSAPSDAAAIGDSGVTTRPIGKPAHLGSREGADIHHLDPHSRKADDAA